MVAIYPVPAQLAALSEAVQGTYSQYGNLAAMREPLKYSFRLTLTLVLLLAMLAAIYGAIFSAQRLVQPGAGPDRRHARGRQGRLRHAPAAAVAR